MQEHDYPELLEEMRKFWLGWFKARGMESAEANNLAKEMVEAFRKEYGGQQLYIPRGSLYEASEEALAIYREYRGTTDSLTELSRKYGKSTIHIRRVIKQVRAYLLRKRQVPLFPSSPEIEPNQ